MKEYRTGQATEHRARGPAHTPRLRLKPKGPRTGYVDGAWWPHSASLTEELPDLLSVLSVRLGAIDRVIYNVADWVFAPRRLPTGGRTVRLDGYQRHPRNTLTALGLGRKTVSLLVIPPGTDEEDAHITLMSAASADSSASITELLPNRAPDTNTHENPTSSTFRRRVRRSRS